MTDENGTKKKYEGTIYKILSSTDSNKTFAVVGQAKAAGQTAALRKWLSHPENQQPTGTSYLLVPLRSFEPVTPEPRTVTVLSFTKATA